MTDDPTPDPRPEPQEPAAAVAPEGATKAEAAVRKPFLLRFPRAAIPGTELSIRSPSVGQDSEIWKDVANDELDDREFTVLLVHRQLDQGQSIEEVGAWPDEQLLDAADVFLSLVTDEPGLDDENDEEHIEAEGDDDEPAEADATSGDQDDSGHAVDEVDETEPEPLTFASLREEIRQLGVRRARRMKRLLADIMDLTRSNAKNIADLVKVDASIFKAMDPFKGVDLAKLRGASLDPFKGLDVTKLGGAAGLDAFKGVDIAKLTGTSKIGDSIAKMFAGTQAMEKLVQPRFEVPMQRIAPIERMPYIGPIARPEVRLLEEVGETLEKMHDDQTRTAEGQIDVMVEQTKLLKAQGEALTALVNDANGQKWPRRVTVGATIIAAVAAVAAALYAGGFIHPFSAAAPPTPAPIVSPSPAASPTLAATPTPVPTPSATPISTPANSSAP